MKRALSVFVVIFILFFASYPSLSLSAEAISGNNKEAEKSVEDALQFSCAYSAHEKKVTVEGTMYYDAFAHHKDSKLVIYAVPPGMSEHDVASDPDSKALAQTEVSIHFGFTFNINDMVDRYSRYAIFLRSSEGELTLGTQAQYPEIKTTTANRQSYKEYFKGIYGCSTAEYSDLDAGTSIIPVYLDELFTDTSARYIYQSGSEQLFFAKNYIDRLDSKVNSLSVSGARVYLQFLLKRDGVFSVEEKDGVEYYLPEVYNKTDLMLVHYATEFLVSRYNQTRGGNIYGIVVGKGWDNYGVYNCDKATTLENYASKCAFYSFVVANSARSINPSIDIVLPFTGDNLKADKDYWGKEGSSFSTKLLIEALMVYFENSLESGLDFSFLIETSEIPFGISNENIEEGVDYEFSEYSSELYAGSQESFADFLNELSSKHRKISKNFMFLWRVPEGLSGNALAAAYTYSYYCLLKDSSVTSFIVDIDDKSTEKIDSVSRIIKLIDTKKGTDVTQSLLRYFNKKDWGFVLGEKMPDGSEKKSVYSVVSVPTLPEGIKGSFKYFDFSDSSMIYGWYKGVGCGKLKIDYENSQTKALKAELLFSDGEYSEVIYDYEYYENFEYTPYLKFELQISDSAEDSLYEVSFLCENPDQRFESSYVVSGNNINDIVLDLSQIYDFRYIEDIKISVRRLNGDIAPCTLWLYSVSGHSTAYDSPKLEELISIERDKIKEITKEDDNDTNIEQTAVAIGIIVVLGALGISAFIAFRKDPKANKNDR